MVVMEDVEIEVANQNRPSTHMDEPHIEELISSEESHNRRNLPLDTSSDHKAYNDNQLSSLTSSFLRQAACYESHVGKS